MTNKGNLLSALKKEGKIGVYVEEMLFKTSNWEEWVGGWTVRAELGLSGRTELRQENQLENP